MFFVWAHKNNPIPVDPNFIDNTNSEFRFRLTYMCMDSLKPGCLKFYIAPIYVIQQNGLYLKCLKDYTKTNMSNACSQEAVHLQTEEPQVFLTGQLTLDNTKDNPYMITQKTKPFNKKYCMIHTAEDIICKVNCIRVRQNYGRVSIKKCHCLQSLSETVRVGMTFVNKTPLAFRYNPFLFYPWKWKSVSVPINYVGPNITIPAQTETDILYNNCYYCSLLPDLTAIILNLPQNKNFYISPCEWAPKQTATIRIINKSKNTLKLKTGHSLGVAYFFIAPKFPLGHAIQKLYKRDMSTALNLPGGIIINATKLKHISHLTQSPKPSNLDSCIKNKTI